LVPVVEPHAHHHAPRVQLSPRAVEEEVLLLVDSARAGREGALQALVVILAGETQLYLDLGTNFV
jgi:hypothetical protein